MLELEGVRSGFGAQAVLHDVSLRLEESSSLGLFGLNGAGKSVTMKVIAGLVPCWEGAVRFRNEDVTHLDPEERVARGMGYAPQARQLFPKLTVEQNLRVGGYLLRRKNKRRFGEILAAIYERFPILTERREQKAGSLSGGEQAMLTIARALAADPVLLLIDEPSSGLAPAVIEEVFAMLEGLRREGMTILLVEQNITFGFRLVDRALILQGGAVVYEGAVDSLDTARVAELLGVGRLLGSHLERAVASHLPEPDSKRSTRAPKRRPRKTGGGTTTNSP